MQPLVSILIPAHNEERTIGTALDALARIRENEWDKMEVIVGLDGCTDSTERIASRYPFVKIYKSEERSGKTALMTKLMAMAKGEIIIIHDADWILRSNNNFRNLIKYFENPKVGGIDDYKTASYDRLPLLSLGESWSNRLLYEYKIKKYATEKDGILYANSNKFPFIVTIFRKSALPQEQLTLCDDGERAVQLMKNGYMVAIPTGDIPHFVINYVKPYTIGSLFRQKVRCDVARRQMQSLYRQYNAGFLEFYVPALLYSIRRTLGIVFGVVMFWLISALAAIRGSMVKVSTKAGWKMRSR